MRTIHASGVRMRIVAYTWCLIRLLAGFSPLAAQQVVDTTFRAVVTDPAYAAGAGPVVLIDAAHDNVHTAEERYAPFARLLAQDGFVVRANSAPFTAASLAGARVLVIANARAPGLPQEWSDASAFTPGEIDAVYEWVRGGGSLLLIADHMPFPGAAAALAERFGILFTNGFALTDDLGSGDLTFRSTERTLADHVIVRGRSAAERVDSVVSFTGQAFRVVSPVEPLLVMPPRTTLVMPVRTWEYTDATPRLPAQGMLQGAVLRIGSGRIAVFGEAAMFTAQRTGAQQRPMGLNAPRAAQNARFLLNVMYWLTGALDDAGAGSNSLPRGE